jgi:hypothetical protein
MEEKTHLDQCLGYTASNIIVDLGADINVLPKATWRALGCPPLERPSYDVALADGSHIKPEGFLQGVEVDSLGMKSKVYFTDPDAFYQDREPYPVY